MGSGIRPEFKSLPHFLESVLFLGQATFQNFGSLSISKRNGSYLLRRFHICHERVSVRRLHMAVAGGVPGLQFHWRSLHCWKPHRQLWPGLGRHNRLFCSSQLLLNPPIRHYFRVSQTQKFYGARKMALSIFRSKLNLCTLPVSCQTWLWNCMWASVSSQDPPPVLHARSCPSPTDPTRNSVSGWV